MLNDVKRKGYVLKCDSLAKNKQITNHRITFVNPSLFLAQYYATLPSFFLWNKPLENSADMNLERSSTSLTSYRKTNIGWSANGAGTQVKEKKSNDFVFT